MPKDFIVYVDFDKTLYDTPRFGQDLKRLIADAAHISVEKVTADIRRFIADLNLGGYDYERHMRSYGLDAGTMWAALEELVAADYLYEDSPAFVQSLCDEGYKPHILSFGEERFQSIKVTSVLKHLVGKTPHEIGFDVIMRKKREHIIARHPGMRGVLIDDKPDQNLPAGFVEITLDRSLQLESARQNGATYVAANLQQAAEIIRFLSATLHT